MATAISAMETAGLQLPVLAKPRFGGRPGSHDLALVRDLAGLQSLVRSLRHEDSVYGVSSWSLFNQHDDGGKFGACRVQLHVPLPHLTTMGP